MIMVKKSPAAFRAVSGGIQMVIRACPGVINYSLLLVAYADLLLFFSVVFL